MFDKICHCTGYFLLNEVSSHLVLRLKALFLVLALRPRSKVGWWMKDNIASLGRLCQAIWNAKVMFTLVEFAWRTVFGFFDEPVIDYLSWEGEGNLSFSPSEWKKDVDPLHLAAFSARGQTTSISTFDFPQEKEVRLIFTKWVLFSLSLSLSCSLALSLSLSASRLWLSAWVHWSAKLFSPCRGFFLFPDLKLQASEFLFRGG